MIGKKWDAANRDKRNAARRQRYATQREKENQRNREWYRANRKRVAAISRKSNLKTGYGMTLDQYESLLQRQGGKCEICKNAASTGKRLVVDHCHVTGRIRGLLCSRCNLAIGMFKDSIDALAAAIEYLKGIAS
jgi:hypothetical protein